MSKVFKSAKRATRRHHKERMKAKARSLYRTGIHPHEGDQPLPRAHHYADNLTLCSGHCCGNPRKWFKYVTRKEERFALDAAEQEREYEVEIGDARRLH